MTTSRLLEVKLNKTFEPSEEHLLVNTEGKLDERLTYIDEKGTKLSPTPEDIKEINAAYSQEVSGFVDVKLQELNAKLYESGMLTADPTRGKTQENVTIKLPSGTLEQHKKTDYLLTQNGKTIATMSVEYKLTAELKDGRYHLTNLMVSPQLVHDVLTNEIKEFKKEGWPAIIYEYKNNGIKPESRFLPLKNIKQLVDNVIAEYRGDVFGFMTSGKANDIQKALDAAVSTNKDKYGENPIVNVNEFLNQGDPSIKKQIEAARIGKTPSSSRFNKLLLDIDIEIANLSKNSTHEFKKT